MATLTDPGMLFSQFLKENLFGIVVVVFAAVIIWRGLNIMSGQIKDKGLGKYAMQGIGLFVIIPVIMILGVNTVLDGQVVAGLLGSLLGYIFGVRTNDKE
jgi:hypothetical protein